jgi:hypothetical protein
MTWKMRTHLTIISVFEISSSRMQQSLIAHPQRRAHFHKTGQLLLERQQPTLENDTTTVCVGPGKVVASGSKDGYSTRR